jgi:transposase, IS5 family
VIERMYHQRQLGEGFIRDSIADCWEPWMKVADEILDDEELIDLVYEALRRRRPQSATRGRKGTPAEVALRMLVLKHMRNWSFEVVEREVRANLVYRMFTRVGAEKVPDAKTLGKIERALGPELIQKVQGRIVGIAAEKKVVKGRKMRVDTTVTETHIHYPTDSSLLGDGVRVLTRTMTRIVEIAGRTGERVRNRMRSVGRRVLEIARISRAKAQKQSQEKLQAGYKRLLNATGQVVAQAKRIANEVKQGIKKSKKRVDQLRLDALRAELERMIPLVRQVMRQTKARLFGNNLHAPEKLVSLFETATQIIRKGKSSKPTEFGRLIKIQEAENQIITDYEVCDQRPADSTLFIKSIEAHQQKLGRVPHLAAADAGFYSEANEKAAHKMGVKRVSMPNRSTKSAERRRLQKTRWFRQGQAWRTGCEGRISVLKRRHGLNRCRYRGDDGMKRWVGLGVIADNLINIGRILALQAAEG